MQTSLSITQVNYVKRKPCPASGNGSEKSSYTLYPRTKSVPAEGKNEIPSISFGHLRLLHRKWSFPPAREAAREMPGQQKDCTEKTVLLL